MQPHVIDDLVLIKPIGKGNYGEVFLTQKKGRSEYYATKKMDRAKCEIPQNWNRLQHEIGILKILNHPNIVKFRGFKNTTNHYYLVTDYCNGGSLLSNLQKYKATYHKPFSEEIVQYLMKQIVSALKYLHFNKIIHRDLKLDNILVTFPNDYDKKSLNMMKATVKIIDFGFATKLNGPLTFTALGTPTNMDPQILTHIQTGIPNAGYNEKADIWSLGTLCYEMLVGHIPFTGGNMEELFQRVKKGNYALPLTLSKEVVSFINGMLQQDPNQRMTAEQLSNHEFLTKHPSQFQPIDVRDISGTIGPGGVINMKSASTPKYNNNYAGNDLYQLWSFFNQPGLYPTATTPMANQIPQVQPMMQLGTQQQYGGYMNPPQQYNVYTNPMGYY